MNTTRSSRTIARNIVKDLVGLLAEQLKTLKDNYLIALLQDLALLDKDDKEAFHGCNLPQKGRYSIQHYNGGQSDAME
eukprot:6863296-Ditylum_brightwellii.AAC.1